MAAGVEPAKTSFPRRRWLAFLDCAAADEEPTGADTPLALNEDVEIASEVHIEKCVFFRLIDWPIRSSSYPAAMMCCPRRRGHRLRIYHLARDRRTFLLIAENMTSFHRLDH